MTDFSSPIIIATVLGIIFTQVIGRFVDHHYDRNYRMLERNLQLKKLLGEDTRNASLDELIRRQLNSYVLYEMGGVQKMKKHKAMLFGIGSLVVASLVICIANFQNSNLAWGSAMAVITVVLVLFYHERKSKWFKRLPAENTKYKAELKGGNYTGNYLMIDVMASDSTDTLNTLDYPYIYVEDAATGMLHSYKRTHSSGTVSISSGEDTDLVSEYTYHRLLSSSVSRESLGTNPVISSLLLRNEQTESNGEIIKPVITMPIKATFSFVNFIVDYFKNRIKRK